MLLTFPVYCFPAGGCKWQGPGSEWIHNDTPSSHIKCRQRQQYFDCWNVAWPGGQTDRTAQRCTGKVSSCIQRQIRIHDLSFCVAFLSLWFGVANWCYPSNLMSCRLMMVMQFGFLEKWKIKCLDFNIVIFQWYTSLQIRRKYSRQFHCQAIK